MLFSFVGMQSVDIYSAGSAVDIYSALHLKCNFTVGLFPPRFSFLT